MENIEKMTNLIETGKTEQLKAHGIRLMEVYGRRVLCTEKQLRGFCLEAMFATEGAEQEHYVDILCDLECGKFICSDGVPWCQKLFPNIVMFEDYYDVMPV